MLSNAVTVIRSDPAMRRTLVVSADGVTDGHAIVQAAVRAGGTTYLPAGTIRMGDDLHVDAPCVLVGEGWASGTTLLFDEGKGVIIHRTNTSPRGTSGEDAIIRDLEVRAASAGVSGSAGITVYARAELANLQVRGFSGNGISILGGDNQGPGGVSTNANRWLMSMVRSTANGGHGVYVIGSDANAGVGQLVDCVSNGGDGIHDYSFLGNTWVQGHTSANTGRAFNAPYATTFSVFVGCYSEGGSTLPSYIGQNCISIGGDHGAGWADDSPGVVLTASTRGLWTTRPIVSDNAAGALKVTGQLGHTDASNSALSVSATESGGHGVRWRYGLGRTGYWAITAGSPEANIGVRIADVANTDGITPGRFMYPVHGFYMRSADGGIWQVTVGNDGVLATTEFVQP